MPQRPALFLTLDVGTTAVKAGLFDAQGRMLASAAREYSLHAPAQGVVELDAEVYWSTCLDALHEVLDSQTADVRAGVVSIAVCSQGETLICLDEAGRPLRHAIVWMDNRAQAEADALREHLGHLPQTGQTDWDPCWPAAKMLWLRQHEPEVFARTHRFVLVEDFINHRLCGVFAADDALYSSSYLLDIQSLTWIEPVLDYLGVDVEQLSKLVRCGQVIDTIRPQLAPELGVAAEVQVVCGAMDLAAALVGSGNIEPGQVTEITGAAEVICNTLAAVPAQRLDSIAVQRHARVDAYLSIGWCPSGGMSLRWLRDQFFAGADYDDLTAMATEIPPGAQGLVFFPYQSGPGTLDLPQHVRGGWYGLELHHTPGHMIRAVMESLAYVVRQNLEAMQYDDTSYEQIRSIGGGASSTMWNQIKANVTDKTILTMACGEAASLGLAVLSATAVGVYASVPDAVTAMVKTDASVEPEPAMVQRYDTEYARYVHLQRSMLVGLGKQGEDAPP